MFPYKPGQLILLIFCAFLFCGSINSSDREKKINEAVNYAWTHAGANKEINWDDEYWNTICLFLDVQDYNNTMDIIRTPEKKYLTEEFVWYWDDKSSQTQFKKMRDEIIGNY